MNEEKDIVDDALLYGYSTFLNLPTLAFSKALTFGEELSDSQLLHFNQVNIAKQDYFKKTILFYTCNSCGEMTTDIIGVIESLISAKNLNEFLDDTKDIHQLHRYQTKCQKVKNKKYHLFHHSQFYEFQRDLHQYVVNFIVHVRRNYVRKDLITSDTTDVILFMTLFFCDKCLSLSVNWCEVMYILISSKDFDKVWEEFENLRKKHKKICKR